ncbi:hypothetical protein CO611_06805 [Lysobacteraceae bacterium NML03-0222]|nr:hypothetical protein CO611_06805 [Xanthomonadaceae bacterium NML03-0222]PJK08787.1 hypothetical protein CO610_05115 [Xanthomonadaceae bacterium NML95-0200]
MADFYAGGEEIRLADRVELSGAKGVVVALIAENAYMEGYLPSDWSYLEKGVLVFFERHGLLHYPCIEQDVRLVSRADGGVAGKSAGNRAAYKTAD